LQKIHGQPLDVRSYSINFGDLCEVERWAEPSNGQISRTITCVALKPTGAQRRRWQFVSLEFAPKKFPLFIRPVITATAFPWGEAQLAIMKAQAAAEDLLVKQKHLQWKISGKSFQSLNDDEAPRQENDDPRILHPPPQRPQLQSPQLDASEDHLVDEEVDPAVIRNPTESYHPPQDPDLSASEEIAEQEISEVIAQPPIYDLRQRPAKNS